MATRNYAQKLVDWEAERKLWWHLHYELPDGHPEHLSVYEMSKKFNKSTSTITGRLRKAAKKWGVPQENEKIFNQDDQFKKQGNQF